MDLGGWEVVRWGDGRPMHVVPHNDLREHELSGDCWCRPDEDADGDFLHHSADRREEYERGRPLS